VLLFRTSFFFVFLLSQRYRAINTTIATDNNAHPIHHHHHQIAHMHIYHVCIRQRPTHCTLTQRTPNQTQ
jgi:hypothetical protein